MRVRAGAPAEVVPPREIESQPVVLREDVAGVEDFHDVDKLRVALHEARAPVRDAGERVGNVDQAALFVYFGNGLGQREAPGQRPRYEHPHRFAVARVDLLRDHDFGMGATRVMSLHKVGELAGRNQLRRGPRAVEGVVVGDGERPQAPPQARGDYGPGFGPAIVGCRGVDMQIGFNPHRTRSGASSERRRAVGAVAAALLAACVLASCGDRAAVYFDEARRYELDYEFEKAARKYELVASAFKRSPLREEAEEGLSRCRAELVFDRAEELIYDGAAYTAISEIAAGRRLDPDNPRGLYLTGIAHRYVGPRDLALEEFDEIVKRYPDSPYGYLGRAEYFRFYVRREEALDDYVRAFRVAHRDVRNRGAAFRGIRDMIARLERPAEEADRYLREGRGVTSSDALDYWVGYYYIRKKPRNYRDAVRYFGAVISSDGSLSYKARARAARAECYARFKDFEKAKTDIDEALAADPENGEYYKVAENIYRALSLPPPRKTQK